MGIREPEATFEKDENGKTLMKLKFIRKWDNSEIIFPEIELDSLQVVQEQGRPDMFNSRRLIPFHEEPEIRLKVRTQKDGSYCTYRELSTTKELTVEEIEKELGYSIKIVK